MSKERLPAAPLTAATSRYALLWLRLGTLFLYVLFHVILGHFPSLVRVVFVHALERLQRIGSEVLFINDSIRANHEGHHSGYPVLSRRNREAESADHRATDHEVYLSAGRCRPLSF